MTSVAAQSDETVIDTAIKTRKHERALKIAFNVAAGMAVAASAKIATVSLIGLAWTAAPAFASLALSAVAVGAAMTVYEHAKARRSAKKAGLEDMPKFFTRRNLKTFGISGSFALAGGLIFMGADYFFSSKQAVAEVAVKAVAPAPVCPTGVEQFSQAVAETKVTTAVQNAMERAGSSVAEVAAQGKKDLGYYIFNGFGGVAENKAVALQLLKDAAEAGNVQAKVDLLYAQYHGLGGLAADPKGAAAAMAAIDTPAAEKFTEAWAKTAGAAAQEAKFSTESIFKGMKLCK